MRRLFSLVLFLSATLVMWVQPMFGKMVLPLLGGTPAVWNTCLVFFQGALLLGYLYAHVQSKWGGRNQLVTHVGLLVLAAIFLPIRLPQDWVPPTDSNPLGWLVALLVVCLGLPFTLISATAPLLQRWYGLSGESGSRDPYFLYAAGNAGSLAGLVGYPLLLEPHLTVSEQSWVWSAGYLCLVTGIVASGIGLWKAQQVWLEERGFSNPPGIGQRAGWLLLTAVPSSLLQSCTTYMTTDVAPVPLLWVLPLGVYLLTFVLVFARRQIIQHALMVELLPIALLSTALLVFWFNESRALPMVGLNLAVLFVTGMVLHGELVRSRPSADRVTEFYLYVAAGGALGGILSVIVAPLLFDRLFEFPLMLAAAAMLLPGGLRGRAGAIGNWDLMLPVCLLAVAAGIYCANRFWSMTLGVGEDKILGGALALVIYGAYLWLRRPISLGLGLGAFMLAGFVTAQIFSTTVFMERSFYGIFGIQVDEGRQLVTLFHGNIEHGSQFKDAESRDEPTCYYYRGGPLGDLFRSMPETERGRKIGVIGLGAGTVSTYAVAGDHWDFYELNPGIARVARDTRFFRYLSDCPARVEVILGDGRLSLSRAKDNQYDLIILDAFSSDSVPVHLLTREALRLYVRKLNRYGTIALHVTNQYVDVGAAVSNLIVSEGLRGLKKNHSVSASDEVVYDACSSSWVVVSLDESCLSSLVHCGWQPVTGAYRRSWSDDYSDLAGYLTIKFR